MAEEILGDIHEEVHATVLSHSEENDAPNCAPGLQAFVSRVPSNASASLPNAVVSNRSKGLTFSKVLSFAGTCSINLILPFLNGLMLGFGELLAHEISWKFSWFSRQNNSGYKIYPEARKAAERNEQEHLDLLATAEQHFEAENANADGFL